MIHSNNHSQSLRSSLLKYSFIVLFFILIGKLYFIQVEAHGRYIALAEKQHWIGKEIPAKRGEILSSDGFPLATNVPAYLVFAVPREVENIDDTASKLIEIIGYESTIKKEDLDEEQLKEKLDEEKKQHVDEMKDLLSQKDLLYMPLAYKQDESTKSKIEEANLKGIYFEKDYKRSYPEGEMASHVLGFVGKNDRGEDQGYYGIEGFYNGELKGIAGRIALEKDALGRPIPLGNYLPVGSDDGRDIVLTINRQLQYLIEKKLEAGVKKYDARDGTVIIMDPQTGKILAMASYPNYNPATWQDYLKDYSDKKDEELTDKEKLAKKYGKKLFPNLAVADVYEPGSIFKPITMSIALETGKITEDTKIESAPYPISGYTISTWNNKYFGLSTPAEILQHSDNTGMARISEAPLQMMQSYTAFINNGKMVTPYIVEKIKTTDASIEFTSPSEKQVISPETAKKIVDMLVSVVEKGEFKFAVLPGYKIAGKTGTAQIAVNGIYDTRQTNCTFIGFAPASEPEF